jgi:hypothetical protein
MRSATRERLFAKLIVDPDTGCLIWTGAWAGPGYGQIMINRRQQYVHRVMYELFAGPIPDGLVIDHLCRNRRCAAPAHLEPVTQRENILRGEGLAAQQVRRTQCPYGHPYDEANTYRFGVGLRKRGCRACTRRRQRERASAS